MNLAVFRHRLLPCFAALLGLMLGFFSRPFFQSLEASAADASGHPSRSPHSDHSPAPLAGGPLTAFLRDITQASAAECEAHAVEVFAAKSSGREIEMEAIFRRWLSLEKPGEILAKLGDLDGHWRTDWNAAFFRAWVVLDESAAMDDSNHHQLSPARALHAIEHGEPTFADYFLHTHHSMSFDDKAVRALTRLASERPEVARLVADAKISSTLKSACITAVARGWATSDPESALAWVQSLGLEQPEKALAAVFAEWIRTDPAAAGEAREGAGLAAARLSDGSTAGRALQAMKNPESASSQINLALNRDPFMDVATLHRHLSAAEIDWERPGSHQLAIDSDGWYGVDPAADAQTAAQLPPGPVRDYIISAICHNWTAHDLPAALSFAEQHGVTSTYLENHRQKPDQEMRETVLAAPESHFSVLFEPDASPPEGISRDQLYALAKEWTEEDPIQAANWLITLEIPQRDADGGSNARLIFDNTLGYHWARVDPLGASRWMEALPDGPDKSRAWMAMRHYVSRYSPDVAFSLSAAYAAGDSRVSLLTRQLETVANEIGHPASLELLNSPGLSPQESATLTDNLNSARSGSAE